MLTTVGQIKIVSDNPQSAMNKVNSWLMLENVHVDICEKYRRMAPCYDDKLYIIEIKFRNINDTEEHHQLDELDVEYQWLMADKAAPLKALHYLWEYKYTGIGSRAIDLQSSINDLLVLKRFAEDKLVELRVLTAKGVDTYSKLYDINAHFPLRNPYDNMLRAVLYKGHKEKNEK